MLMKEDREKKKLSRVSIVSTFSHTGTAVTRKQRSDDKEGGTQRETEGQRGVE